MDLSALALFAATLVVSAGSPGPSIAALVARVVSRGPGSVMPFLAAMWIGEAIWLTAAVFGLSYIAATFATAFLVVKYAGVAYLLYLAWKMWTAPAVIEGEAMPEAGSALGMFMAGMAVTLGNPKLMAFYLAILPALLNMNSVTLAGWAELVMVMLVVLAAVDLTWVAVATAARRWLRTPRAVRLANRFGATAIGGAAIVIAAK